MALTHPDGTHHERLLYEESELLHRLSSIRQQLNHLTPISKLPPEILSHVFSFCVTHPYSRTLAKNTLAFTQACRTWRTLALSTSKLWSTIDICHARHAELCLSRSGGASLSVIAPISVMAFERPGSLVGARNRIRKIDVVMFPESMLRLFKQMIMGLDSKESHDEVVLGSSSSLGMGTNATSTLVLENLTQLNLRLPSIVERADLSFLRIPSIQKLSLDSVNLDWMSIADDIRNRNRGLKALSLSTLTISMHELIALIEQSEEVFLEDLHVPDYEDGIYGVSPLSLRTMTIVSKNQAFVDALLSRLTLPSTTEVVLRYRDIRVSGAQAQARAALAAAIKDGAGHWSVQYGVSSDVMAMLGYPFPVTG
ncbi:hypothetical protein AAF712_008438 [Marasmius tenuissimus]|uniref:F-box domain-containing protein n=1 Tax=Marasmius tenuissimus TaxID=585030 RepID=A0ABR2ZU72_9AGAR